MKIAIISFNLDVPAGGNVLIFSLAQQLQKKGHKVTIFAPQVNKNIFPELQEGLDIREVVLGFKLILGPAANLFHKIFQKIQEDKRNEEAARKIAHAMNDNPDVVSCHDFAYRVAYFYKKKKNSSRTIWVMNEPPYGYLPKENWLVDFASWTYNFLQNWKNRKFMKAIDLAVTLDEWDANWAKNRGIATTIIRSGIDTQRFSSAQRASLSGRQVRLLSIGNPNKYRRFEDAIEATRLLKDAGYAVHLTIIARNVWHEDAYCSMLSDLVVAHNLEHAVDLKFDGASEEEIVRYYGESDIFVHPIYVPPPRNGSTWGLVVFEAMAAGMPVILCRTAGAAEVLKDGETALFVDPMNPEQIAEKVEILIKKPELYNRIAKNGQKFTKENISWEKYAENMLKIFSSR